MKLEGPKFTSEQKEKMNKIGKEMMTPEQDTLSRKRENMINFIKYLPKEEQRREEQKKIAKRFLEIVSERFQLLENLEKDFKSAVRRIKERQGIDEYISEEDQRAIDKYRLAFYHFRNLGLHTYDDDEPERMEKATAEAEAKSLEYLMEHGWAE